MNDIVPDLALALGRLRRSPGKGDGWVAGALRALQRIRPDDYQRLCQRLGFASRLAELAAIGDEDKATMTLGLFFDTLVASSSPEKASSPPRPWMEYLLRNDDWLAPCILIAQTLQQPGWGGCVDYPAAVVAKVTATFDAETMEHQSRPLQVLYSLREEAESPALEHVVDALWSEQGQELCGQHVRPGGHGYTLSPGAITESLRLLKPGAQDLVPHSENVVAPIRLSGRSMRHAVKETEPTDLSDASVAAATSENFERRRRALRASPVPADALRSWDTGEQQVGERVEGSSSSAPTPFVAERSGPTDRPWLPSNNRKPSLRQGQQEEDMQITSESSNLALAEKVETLRSRLEQIERSAAEAQELLASLAPQLEDFCSSMNALEAAMTRWKGQTRNEPKVA